jgi:hypothetical protein
MATLVEENAREAVDVDAKAGVIIDSFWVVHRDAAPLRRRGRC